ncbi:thioredoxin family protein [Bacteroidota bacterium]
MKKLKILLSVIVITAFTSFSFGQDEKPKLYYPEADAKADIMEAVKSAKEEGKNVFLQIGGNWCGWCIKFHGFCKDDEEISDFIKENYEVVKVNYGSENMNLDIMEDLEFPQRFGFPVFVILDGDGHRLHTQNSAYLEEGSSYNKKKVLEFYKHWSPKALNPDSYKK